jgi:predicted HicB family RNase H-like nuclease
MDYFLTIVLFTGTSFVAYGINSFISKRMKKEFKRWGLESKRKIIASCQLVGGLVCFLG